MYVVVYAWAWLLYMISFVTVIKLDNMYKKNHDEQNILVNVPIEPNKTTIIKRGSFNYNRLPSFIQWKIVAPPAHNVKLNCTATEKMCDIDDMIVSRSGHPEMLDAETMCGDADRPYLTALSRGTRMNFGLTVRSNKLSSLQCKVEARPVTDPYCTCGYNAYQGKSNNSEEVNLKEYPMVAVILYDGNPMCAGTIIDKRHVLTSGSCVREQPRQLLVVLGYSSLCHDDGICRYNYTKQFGVARLYLHHNRRHVDYNIALLRINEDFTFNQHSAPACLPFKFANTDFRGANLTMIIFHRYITLKKLNIEVACTVECAIPDISPSVDKQMCAYPRLYPHYHSLPYESFAEGGPVLFTDPNNGLFYLYGLVSKRHYDEVDHLQQPKPLYHLKVAPLIDWILHTTRDDCDNCYCNI